jgi:hypothetical protein
MKELQINRTINGQQYTFTLSRDELGRAYCIRKKQYLKEDFADYLDSDTKNANTRFNSEHLEKFPELADWLDECFDHFYDANMSHNDLVELTINHLNHASQTPEFFNELALLAGDRGRLWEALSSILYIHQSRNCACGKSLSNSTLCPAAKYLNGGFDIGEFFYLEEGKGDI